MTNKNPLKTIEEIKELIYEVRGQEVMIDSDLASLYGYETKNFNLAVKRNISKFNDKMMFQLTKNELKEVARLQIETSRNWIIGNTGGRTFLPYVFTIEGIKILGTILKKDLVIIQTELILQAFAENQRNELIETQSVSIELAEKMLVTIRNQKVVLDFELANFYGYDVKTLNQQVKRNIEKFPLDFMFQLTKNETFSLLKSQIVTANIYSGSKGSRGGRVALPYAFTEQGIYMLMTVLKGELATKQSILLIRMFKMMKDYIVNNNQILSSNELIKVTRQVDENTYKIQKLEDDNEEIKKDLTKVMDYFIDPSKYKQFFIYNNQRVEASIAYQEIVSTAKESIILIDDYIGLKTLKIFKVCPPNIKITIYSDNASPKDKVTKSDLNDFKLDTGKDLLILPTHQKVHNRYFIIDEKDIYDLGGSPKDGGNKISTIKKLEDCFDYHILIDRINR